jgi:hypothetical protein
VGCALVALLMVSARAEAHLMPRQQGTLNVLDNAVFAVFSLPLTALADAPGAPVVDEDRDGRLADAEVAAHQAQLRDQVLRRVRLYDGEQLGRVEFLQLTVEVDDHAATGVEPAHFLVLMKVAFAGPPAALRLSAEAWGTASADRQLTIKATRGRAAEVAVLTPRHPQQRFFSVPAQGSRGEVTGGAAHAPRGLDPLLVVLAAVAIVGWSLVRRGHQPPAGLT